jgi:predicted alpha-1,2-mannosidase
MHFRKNLLFILINKLSLILFANGFSAPTESVDFVDPFIGTDFYAHTFPGSALPFSMVQLSPDGGNRGWDYSSGYQFRDNTIMGFSHTHYSGSGWASNGDLLFMPTVDNIIRTRPGDKENPDAGYRSRFSHDDESASPGYYAVKLQDYNIQVELTSTRRAGFHRYTFPKAKNAHILIDLAHCLGIPAEGNSHIKFIDRQNIEGYKASSGGTVYFAAKFSRPFQAYGTWDNSYDKPETQETVNPYKNAESGPEIGAFINYQTSENEVVLVKVGISLVSVEGAHKNLQSEIPDWNFDRVHDEARAVWNEELKKIEINGGTDEQKQIFYTALYHSFLAQYISNDVDGKYIGMDGNVHVAKDFDNYPTFLAWDTFRSEQPLMTLVASEHVNDVIKSIEKKVRHYGWLPAQHVKNNFGQGMVGDHLVPMIVDAYKKGFTGFNAEYLYQAMKTKATQQPPLPLSPGIGREGLEYYQNLGYNPADRVRESVSNTLEAAYDDACIATMAKALGKDEDYELFNKRSQNYKNVFDAQTQFMRPRLEDGSWLKMCDRAPEIAKNGGHSYYDCFDPLWIGRSPNRHFTESNAWQYLWFVPHDVQGLIGLFGGREHFIKKLDTFFDMSPEPTGGNYVGAVGTIGQYVHGNQPSHQIAYFYNYAGAPWKTQEKVHQVMDNLYQTGPAGICGNEDMGSLSSWYVLSAMGLYSVCPGQNIYVIGSPLFAKATIHLKTPYEKGQFTIKANNVSTKNKYIQSATLNGKSFDRSWIRHSEIVSGGTLVFEMGLQPNKEWATGPESAPPSMNE